MRLKDPEYEELRHTLAHLWCALDALAGLAPKKLEEAGLHLVDCEAAIFTEEELDDGASTVSQEEETEGQGQKEVDEPVGG
jgi:hypothetical protein